MTVVGRVAGLWRYPVKSMAAERLEDVEVSWHGLAGDRRWAFARDGVREALADPHLADDGPLFLGSTRLPVAAVADLTTWAAEHPPLARRAILTLIEQHQRGLLDADRPELGAELAYQMLDPETPLFANPAQMALQWNPS